MSGFPEALETGNFSPYVGKLAMIFRCFLKAPDEAFLGCISSTSGCMTRTDVFLFLRRSLQINMFLNIRYNF
uniref:Uncharacterized protein n=1 Tax=Rhizophora mucronata TaxID=61149 RepID=A0A2P2MYM4_RHIMU